jgi:signal transduction histidine kinase
MPDIDAKPIASEQARALRLFAVLQKALGHEFPNILIGIQGLVRLLELEEGGLLSADGHDYLERVAAGAAKAHALAAALSDVARLGKGKTPAETVDLAEVVAEAVAEANQLAQGQFAAYHGLTQVLILAVPHLALRKVLGLLLRRAATARPGESPRHVEVSARVNGTEVEIRLADDGPALLPEQIARLFEPFMGADDTGLEMFLLRQLVEDWGGRVRVESKPGSGNVIAVTCHLSPVPCPSHDTRDRGPGTRDKGQ